MKAKFKQKVFIYGDEQQETEAEEVEVEDL